MSDPPGCAIEQATYDAAVVEVGQQQLELEIAEAARDAAEIELRSCLGY